MEDPVGRNVCNKMVTAGIRHDVLLSLGATAAFCLLSCLSAMLIAYIFRVGRRFTHRISLYLLFSISLTEVTFCLQTAMYNYDSSSTAYVAGCKAIGFLLEFSVWVMLLYMSVLVFHLACLTILIEIRSTILIGVTYRVLILTLSEPAENTERKARHQAVILESCYVLLPILIPLSFVWIPFIHDAYGLAGAWCWIRQKDDNCNPIIAGVVEQYALWYVPQFVLCTVNTIAILAILVILCKQLYVQKTQDEVYKNVLRENAPLMIYPVLYQVFNWVSLAQRIHETITNNASYLLWMMHAVIPPLWGLFFAVSYSLYILIERFYRRPPTTVRERDPLLRSEIDIIDSSTVAEIT